MRLLWIVMLLVVFGLPVGSMAYFEHLLGSPAGQGPRELVVVKPGSGVSAIADELEYRGLLRSSQAFSLWLRLKGWDRSVKAGVYAISPAMSGREVASLLFAGRGEDERLTIPEGLSIGQVASLLDGVALGSGPRFRDWAHSPADFEGEFPWLAKLPEKASLEGFLFPDTYVIARTEGFERDLVRMMLARFDQVVMPAFEARGEGHGLSLHETVTLASIVEKEATVPTERATIAGVFFNRLKLHMPFGSDPTVEYVLKKHQGAQGLSLKDVAVDSPYNTYKYPGLPPGPIANPGLASVEAVLRPEKTTFLYFVARGDGTHAFTRSYQEHLAAQRRIWAARSR